MRGRMGRMLLVVALIGVVVGGAGAAGGAATGSQEVVFIATGENFPDALGAGSVAALNNAPVLLVRTDSVPAATLAELNRLHPDRIVIVGGTGVVSAAVADALAGLSFTPMVERLSGPDRFATAAAISASRFPAVLDAATLDGRDSSQLAAVAAYSQTNQVLTLTTDYATVRSVALTAPAAGVVIVNSTATVYEETAGDSVTCSITERTSFDSFSKLLWTSNGPGASEFGVISGTRGFDVAAGETLTVNLVCYHTGTSGSSNMDARSLTAVFVPSP